LSFPLISSCVEDVVEVDDASKVCKSWIRDGAVHMVCNLSRFVGMPDAAQYRQIHHEFATQVPGLEPAIGPVSTYGISDQLSDFLVTVQTTKLGILNRSDRSELGCDGDERCLVAKVREFVKAGLKDQHSALYKNYVKAGASPFEEVGDVAETIEGILSDSDRQIEVLSGSASNETDLGFGAADEYIYTNGFIVALPLPYATNEGSIVHNINDKLVMFVSTEERYTLPSEGPKTNFKLKIKIEKYVNQSSD
jgi:hypothetical protein